MSNNSKKLVELIEDAKVVNYIDPNKNISEYNKEEILYGAIYISLQNEIQIRAGLLLLDMFPPVKFFVKGLMRQYIKKFTLFK